MTKRDEVVALQEMMLENSIELDALIQGRITTRGPRDETADARAGQAGEHVMPADAVTNLRVFWCRRALIVRGFWICSVRGQNEMILI